MKTIEIPSQAAEINALLEEARQADVIVQSADGTEFMLSVINEFDREIALTRKNERLMALLEARARQTKTVPLDEVKRQLGLTV